MDNLQIANIGGVDCYEKDGVAYLKLENVARGLGFTQEKGGVEYIRWDRIEQYLAEMGFPQKWGKDDYIPENVFYRLAMKAKNSAAEKFQARVADEIIPSVRKTGAYITPDATALAPKSTAEMFLMQGQINVEFEQRLNKTDEKLNALTDQTAAIAEQTTALTARMDGVAKAFHRSDTVGEWKVETEMAIREMSTSINFRGRLYCELETRSGCSLNSRLTRARNRLRKNGMTLTQANKVNKLDIICMDKNLRNIFDGIIREHQASAMAGVDSQRVIDAEFEEVR